VDPVGRDQQVAARAVELVGAVAPDQRRRDAAVVLREPPQPVARMDAVPADPRPRGLVEHALQPAAVDGELRVVVARVEATGLAPDLLAEPVGVDQLSGREPTDAAADHQHLHGCFPFAREGSG
jgi:hypothetical protein